MRSVIKMAPVMGLITLITVIVSNTWLAAAMAWSAALSDLGKHWNMESLMRLASAKLVVFHHLYPFLVNVCETLLCTPYHVYPYHRTRMHRDRSKPGLDIRIFMMAARMVQVCSK